MPTIIFTGLDEMLLPSENVDYSKVLAIVEDLRHKDIPLIPVTDNTRAEVEVLVKKIGLNTPFVVEQGSGIFIPQNNSDFEISQTDTIDDYFLYQLGCTYTEARAALKAVQEEISKILRGFGDLDEENIQAMMGGISLAAARRAKSREFSEYFLTPNRLEIGKLQEVAAEYGFKIIPGGKLSLMMGGNADTKKAIAWLKKNYRSNNSDSITTIGIGSTKDWQLLEAVDIPVIVPTSAKIDSTIADKNWQTVSHLGMEGWQKAIAKICAENTN